MKINNALFVLLGIVVLAIGLGAYVMRPSPAVKVPIGAKAGDLSLEPCTVKLNSGKYAADCGTLIVPENRSKENSRLIALPVTRIRATGENPAEPIFYLEGGPGISNMHNQPPAGLLVNHDYVMIGYRGVDGSSVLDCPEVSEALKGDGNDVLNAQSRAKITEANRQCAERLQSEGVDLDGYTIEEVAADMNAGRIALGYERINLLSASYGTRVAQIYAYQYPGHIQRSAMVGVNPPGGFVWEPSTIDSQIELYSQRYAQSENPRTADLAATMRSVAHNMPTRWLFFRIDPGKVKSVSFAMFFNRNTSAMVFDAYIAAENGDPSGLALMSIASDFVLPKMFVWGEFYSKGLSAEPDSSRDLFTEMDPADSIIGSPLTKLIWGSVLVDGKMVWPTKQIPQELRQVQPSNVETLLVSGNLDFSTPVQNATDNLLPHLTHGRQVILSDMGHVDDMMKLQPEATERLLVSFYDTGVADDSLYKYAPMDFHVSLGFPALAKILLGTGVLIVIAVVAALWSVARRMRAGISDEATRQT